MGVERVEYVKFGRKVCGKGDLNRAMGMILIKKRDIQGRDRGAKRAHPRTFGRSSFSILNSVTREVGIVYMLRDQNRVKEIRV